MEKHTDLWEQVIPLLDDYLFPLSAHMLSMVNRFAAGIDKSRGKWTARLIQIREQWCGREICCSGTCISPSLLAQLALSGMLETIRLFDTWKWPINANTLEQVVMPENIILYPECELDSAVVEYLNAAGARISPRAILMMLIAGYYNAYNKAVDLRGSGIWHIGRKLIAAAKQEYELPNLGRVHVPPPISVSMRLMRIRKSHMPIDVLVRYYCPFTKHIVKIDMGLKPYVFEDIFMQPATDNDLAPLIKKIVKKHHVSRSAIDFARKTNRHKCAHILESNYNTIVL